MLEDLRVLEGERDASDASVLDLLVTSHRMRMAIGSICSILASSFTRRSSPTANRTRIRMAEEKEQSAGVFAMMVALKVYWSSHLSLLFPLRS